MDENLNENLETEIPVEETEIESEISNEILNARVNPFCVISKNTFGEYNVRDIQTNGSWSSNPYGEDYAVVPDEMVTDIMETRGFCDIELNEDGTEIVGFTALEIPEIPVPEPEPTVEDRVVELEAENAELAEQIAVNEMTMIENYEAQEEFNAQTENALIELYEMMEV